MSDTVIFEDPTGEGPPIELATVSVPYDLPDREIRLAHITEPDPYYVDLGMLYRLASLETVRRDRFDGIPLHLALRGHMGTGKERMLTSSPSMTLSITGPVSTTS